MRKKRLMVWLGLLGVLAVGCFSLIFWLTAPKHRITRKSFDAIEAGITEAQVEAIFGVPPGNYSRGAPVLYSTGADHPVMGKERPGINAHLIDLRASEWIGEDIAVKVWFDRDGRVFNAGHGRVLNTSESTD